MGEDRTEPTGGDRRDRQRLTVPEAATVLGMTVDAVRGRIRRGTLDSEREGGTVYVYVDTDPTDRRGQSETVERPSPDEASASIVEELRDRVSYLERQVEEEREARRRADTILAQLSQANAEQARTIRALEAPQEPQNEPESAGSRSDRVETPPETPHAAEGQAAPFWHSTDAAPEAPTRRPWWRRIFGD